MELEEPKYIDYQSPFKRLESFSNYPKPYPTKKQLVDAGFFYIGTNIEEDDCQCYYCGVRLYHWKENDDPREEHKKFRANCPIFKELDKVVNPERSILIGNPPPNIPSPQIPNLSNPGLYGHYPQSFMSIAQPATNTVPQHKSESKPNLYGTMYIPNSEPKDTAPISTRYYTLNKADSTENYESFNTDFSKQLFSDTISTSQSTTTMPPSQATFPATLKSHQYPSQEFSTYKHPSQDFSTYKQ